MVIQAGCHSDMHSTGYYPQCTHALRVAMVTTQGCVPAPKDGSLTAHLADPDGGWSPRESRHARLEGRDVTEAPCAAGVDGGHTELVRLPRLQLLAASLHFYTLRES